MQLEWSSFQRLTEANVKKFVPTSAGVYIRWVQRMDDSWRCVYVGQANDLERRLLEHHAASEQNECIKKKVSNNIVNYVCARVDRQADRDGVERSLYREYKNPECNEQEPSAAPIQVNLP